MRHFSLSVSPIRYVDAVPTISPMMPLCVSLSHTAVKFFGFAPVELIFGNSVRLCEEVESHVEGEILAHLENSPFAVAV
jgi:hypothetical protein